MDRSTVIYFMWEINAKDTLGVYKPIPEKNWVTYKAYAEVTSVTMSEMLQASQLGLKPAFRFRVFEHDYGGQKYVLYEDAIYAIYRVYRDKNEIVELYTEEKVGVIR